MRITGLVLALPLLGFACGSVEPPPPRILVAGIKHESNNFNPLFTEEKDFHVLRGEEIIELTEWAGLLQDAGAEIVPTLIADSHPFAVVSRQAYEKFKEEILEGARQAGPVDGVYLDFHGALHADGYADAQADLVSALREIVGDRALVAASFDLHGNVSEEFIGQLNIATAYRTAPHVDEVETQKRAVRLLLESIQQDLRPSTALVKVPILVSGDKAVTSVEPLKSIYDQLPTISDEEGLLDASIFVGMAWTDVPRTSMSVTVVAAGEAYRERAEEKARALAAQLWEKRGEFDYDFATDTIDGAIKTALEAPEGTVFITDSGDNPGAGGAGDTTLALERLLALGVKDAVVAGVVDSEAVELCEKAGVGQRVDLEVGGKLDTLVGKPFPVSGIVRFVSPPGSEEQALALNAGRPEGRSAVVEVDGVLLVLVSVRRHFTRPEHFQEVEIDPLAHKIVVVKLGYLTQRLRDIAPRTIMAVTPGFVYQAIETLPYENVRRPIYPLDPDMSWTPES